MKLMRTKEERLRDYQRLTNLMLEDNEYKNNCWKCVKEFYKRYYHATLDDVAGNSSYTQPSTVERDWRKLRENNPKLRDLELSQDDFKQTALDSAVVDKNGTVSII